MDAGILEAIGWIVVATLIAMCYWGQYEKLDRFSSD